RGYPLLVESREIRFPQAVKGLSRFYDLPARILLDEHPVAVYPPMPAVSGVSVARRGTFREREGVDRYVAVRVSRGKWRVALILDWRGRPGGASEPAARCYDAADPDQQVEGGLRFVWPALRYLVGWLAASGVEAADDGAPRAKWEPRKVIDAAVE